MTPFTTPNYPILATYDSLGLKIDWHNVKSLSEFGHDMDLVINTKMSTDVMHLENFPLIQKEVLQSTICCDSIKGMIIELFGIGNMQTNRPDLVEILKKELTKGKFIFYTTMCQKGVVMDIYENSASAYGLMSCYDMTTPAAYTK